MLEAGSVLTAVISSVSLLNTADDIGKNKNGEGIIQQNIANQKTKDIVGDVKTTISAISVITNIANSAITGVTSPAAIISSVIDALSVKEAVQKKIEPENNPR